MERDGEEEGASLGNLRRAEEEADQYPSFRLPAGGSTAFAGELKAVVEANVHQVWLNTAPSGGHEFEEKTTPSSASCALRLPRHLYSLAALAYRYLLADRRQLPPIVLLHCPKTTEPPVLRLAPIEAEIAPPRLLPMQLSSTFLPVPNVS